MTQLTLVLPYPLSANRLWRTAVRGKHAVTYVSAEGKAYKADVERICRAAGVREPIKGRCTFEVWLFPNRPQDWQKRMRLHGANWDDTVASIDLDNANKVLLDALKGVAIEDDKWVRQIVARRMEPDQHGARVIVRITAINVEQPQMELVA